MNVYEAARALAEADAWERELRPLIAPYPWGKALLTARAALLEALETGDA